LARAERATCTAPGGKEGGKEGGREGGREGFKKREGGEGGREGGREEGLTSFDVAGPSKEGDGDHSYVWQIKRKDRFE